MSLSTIVNESGLDGSWELGEEGEAFTATATLPDGRSQRVVVRPARADEGRWIRVFSRIGQFERLSPRSLKRALEVNFEMLGGAIALNGDDLVVMQSLVAGTIGEGELRTAVESVARLADEYERAFFGTDAE